MACTQQATCPLVRIFAGRPSLRVWREWYCDGQHTRCARFRRASYGEEIPPTLLPNGASLEAPEVARA